MKTKSKTKTERNIFIAFILNLSFAIFEIIGGIFTNSISILSDALHDIGDALSLGLSAFLEKKSKKDPNSIYTFGYLRFSVLGAFLTSSILVIGSIVILYSAIPKLFKPEVVNYDGMIIFAIIGIIVNGIASAKTSHGHTLNEKAVNLHMFEDVLSWGAVLIGSIVIKYTNLYIIDPIMSIAIAFYILFHVIKNFKEVAYLFLVKSPKGYNEKELKHSLESISNVKDVHHIHAWSLDEANTYITLHVALDKELNSTELINLKHEIKEHIYHKGNFNHITIEFDFFEECCNERNCKIVQPEHTHHHHHNCHNHSH